jgi:hypothetical protein
MGKLFTQGWYDRVEARIALAIAKAAGGVGALGNRVVSPNDFATNQIGNIAPTGAGVFVAVVDITPRASGLLYVSGYLGADATSVGVDQVILESGYYPGLTGITGGTLIAPGLTTAQGAPITAVTLTGAPTQIALSRAETQAPAGALTGAWSMPIAFPVHAVAGQRTGITFFLISANARTFTNLQLSIDVTEQP